MSWATHKYFTRIAAMHFIFTCIGCTLLTCDMYMCRLRHINDPVISSLKMEGISLLYFIFHIFCFLSFHLDLVFYIDGTVCSISNFRLFNLYLFDFFYVLSTTCSSSGGIRDTCSTRCENWISKINMHNSAERSQMRQQCNNARYTHFPLPRNARA
jgi:hypothetical protein